MAKLIDPAVAALHSFLERYMEYQVSIRIYGLNCISVRFIR